jgi:hypothetical protein
MEDFCWICNEWQEVTFQWFPGYSNEDAICGPVFLHINFENYRGIFIGDSNSTKIIFKRMVP